MNCTDASLISELCFMVAHCRFMHPAWVWWNPVHWNGL